MKTRLILFTIVVGLFALGLLLGPGAGARAQEAAPALEGEGQSIRLVIQPGESLAKFAPIYGVSGSAMLAANPAILNPDIVYPGQTLIIPVIKTRTPSLATPFYYIAQSGDNIVTIARQFEMDPGTVKYANGMVSDTVIAGRAYLIPAGPHYFTVRRGDTLDLIALRYGVSTASLLNANPNVPDPVTLLIGQRIFIPIQYDAQPRPFSDLPPPEPTLPPTATGTATSVPAEPVPTSTPRPTATSIAAANNFITTVVQLNESLLTHTQRYGVSGSAILAVNPKLQINPDLIYPGDVLTIPVVISFTPSRSTPFFYAVQSGDTALTIANRFEMTSDTLITANPRASFAAGTTILIPAGPHIYFVQANDTLASIAAKYLVTESFLVKYNPALVNGVVFTGQRIFIPVRYDAAPVPFN